MVVCSLYMICIFFLSLCRLLVLDSGVKMGDESPTLSFFTLNNKSIDHQQDIHIELQPSRRSSLVTLEEIAPQNNTITDRKQTQSSNQVCCIKKSVKDKGLYSADKNIRRYYKKMEETNAAFEQINTQDFSRARRISSNDGVESNVSIAVKLSLLCNIGLLIAKAVASYLSGSMSIISSLVDSAVDLISSLVVWFTSRAIKSTDYYEYPEGKTRLEPISIIVLAVIMAVASIQVIITCVTKIIEGSANPGITYAIIAIISATVVIKMALFLYCRRLKSPSTIVLAQDHRNDVMSNAVALGFGYLGYKVWSNADPIGAILISIYIFVGWYRTGRRQIRDLTGHTACPIVLQKLLWVCMNHDRRIQFIDTLRAYHFGFNILVEAHIVLPPDMNLSEAHDIGESLQNKLESYSEVERAFVHIDYDFEHHPSMEHKMGQPWDPTVDESGTSAIAKKHNI